MRKGDSGNKLFKPTIDNLLWATIISPCCQIYLTSFAISSPPQKYVVIELRSSNKCQKNILIVISVRILSGFMQGLIIQLSNRTKSARVHPILALKTNNVKYAPIFDILINGDWKLTRERLPLTMPNYESLIRIFEPFYYTQRIFIV